MPRVHSASGRGASLLNEPEGEISWLAQESWQEGVKSHGDLKIHCDKPNAVDGCLSF
jgi:hypothetical protein